MLISAFYALFLALVSIGGLRAATPTTTSNNGPSKFVTVDNGKFRLGDKPFQYIGTSAYWLQLLDNDDDMNKTLSEIASRGIKVVRTWAFNDVTEIPPTGVWLRVFHENGTIELNTGENGIIRLDRIVRVAEQVGIYVLFSLTNNWFPRVANKTQPLLSRGLNGQALPRNYLSNDYGGMDTYVKRFRPNVATSDLVHDIFYTDQNIRNAYKSYAEFIVKRYSNATSVIGWEAANDPRCNSTLPASTVCNPQIITKWTADVANTIKEADPNHLVATGDSGFYCVDCDKVYPYTAPPPAPSAAVRRMRREGPLTSKRILAKDPEWKKRNLPPPSPYKRTLSGLTIRGKWNAPKTSSQKRQSNSFGPLFDGSFGVDTEDLLNAPGVDFSSFQLFPDQNTYGPIGTNSVSNFSEIVQQGIDWLVQHASTANSYGKPSTLNGFGLVTNVTSNTFAPFNSSIVHESPIGTTQSQQIGAYTTWINTAIDNDIQGIIHYQWGQTNITQSSSIAITQQSGVGSINSTTNTFYSPNDGYAAYDSAIKDTLEAGVKRITARNTSTRKRTSLNEF
ncbi:hypothetical protein FRB91_009184 [Serendipita sp. 411]|nr:hypothetical protein FRC18_002412 [Serendipita sp. 400]KAG8861273.1 hypothetical protein FRB91_009184 [Serendipita sp. 411]